MGIFEGANPEWIKQQRKEFIKDNLNNVKYYHKDGVNKFEWNASQNIPACKKCQNKNGIYDITTIIKMIKNMHKDCENEYCRCCVIPIVD